jgi:hypothetical protein
MQFRQIFTLIATVLYLFVFQNPVFAQREKSASSPIMDKLWFGGGAQIGFSAFNGSSVFGIGISPMMGYKFNNFLSAGPRLSLLLSTYKFPGSRSKAYFEYETGIFLRGRVFRGFFLQGEVGNEWRELPDLSTFPIQKVIVERLNKYLGAGYNWGNGRFGTEVSLFYNFTIGEDIFSNEQPIEYRFGFTYNFY